MMLRTIVRSDEVAFPWLAPAGTRRGIVDNAEAIGYINGQTGEFNTIATGQGLRDVLYTNKINPITFIPGIGITNYGNKTEAAVASALDRINVARLVAFIRGRLNEIGKTFVFEPNDQITRNEISNAINGLMIDLVAKRGIYDYLVVCDESNNTPARIDRNELYVDIAIEPVKAVEFIYIPVRIKNTGEIAAGSAGTTA
jgi:phage tail sheath protein FI